MRKEFTQGIKDGFPICLGYFSVSVAYGLTAALAGVPVWAATLISVSNLTSAGQFAGTNLMVAGGALLELIVTTLIINARYFLMAFSVSQKVDDKMTLAQRFAVSFGITDEIFAVSMQRKTPLTAAYMAGLILTPVIGWTAGTFCGAAATSFMPQILSNALGIALYAMFIAIIIPPAHDNKNVLAAILIAVGLSLCFTYVPFVNGLSGGWAVIIITLAASALCATVFPVKFEGEGEI
jgi:predicted branched-subunit amino acid permease